MLIFPNYRMMKAHAIVKAYLGQYSHVFLINLELKVTIVYHWVTLS